MSGLPSKLAAMKKLNVALTNCHGIRELNATFDFKRGNAIAVYAPNGTMKTSLAQTFKDFAKGSETIDHMFRDRESQRSITDEVGTEIDTADVVVVLSYDEDLGPSKSTSTLLVNAELRKEYEALQADLLAARGELVAALKAQSGTKQDVIRTVSQAFMPEDDRFFEALMRTKYEVDTLDAPRFADLPYDVLFNDKLDAILKSKDLQSELAQYVTRWNELLDESAFFSRETFSYYNAENVTKSLGANGFFAANHSLVLQAPGQSRTVTSPKEFEELVAEEKQRITDDEVLRKKLILLEKALQRNENTRQFFAYVSEHVELLPEFANIDLFRQKVWQSYLKSHEELFTRVVTCFAQSEARQKEIERAAANERTQWERVIEIFNDRFFVPFRLGAENKHRVALGQEDVLKLVFKFEEGDESTDVAREELLAVLSNGEKKALYILNVLFEMEARKASGRETLFVIDDLADSFDYKNKYAIIQYLKEMAEHTNFKLILLTHNFDFFRTLLSRGVVTYKQCFMAQKGEAKVVLSQAEHVNNPFIRAFKLNFFSDGMQRVASIPFVRNILEYTKGTDDPDYMRLTSLLHWKQDSLGITNGDLDRIFKETFPGYEAQAWDAPSDPVVDLIYAQADCALQADEGVNFENKIVLSIATRLQAEKFMVGELNDQSFTDAIDGNQTAVLFNSFKNRSCGTPESTATLDTVVLMTPENIHVNSFMYEPIIDMSDVALRSLYAQVKTL